MTAGIYRILAALYLSERVPDLINQCRVTIQSMTGKPEYANCSPSLSEVAQEVDKLEKAELAAKTKAEGTAQARDEQKLVVISKMRLLQAWVQGLADSDLGHAAALITGASMSIRKPSTRTKADLAAWQDVAQNLVFLVGRAAKGRGYYEWEWSTDQQTWTGFARTLEAKATFTGAAPMTTYAFRYRAFTKKGPGSWSSIVTLFVK